jgi:hypothetical protein
MVVQICLLRQKKHVSSNGRKERESGQEPVFPSPPFPWAGAPFVAEMAASDF